MIAKRAKIRMVAFAVNFAAQLAGMTFTVTVSGSALRIINIGNLLNFSK